MPSNWTPAHRQVLEQLLTELEAEAREPHCTEPTCGCLTPEASIDALRAALDEIDRPVDGSTSDGYHTFDELYAYRKAFNALLFNQWAALELYDVHKSWRHSNGEPCFSGGWFIVVAQTPEGQISNHYKAEDWSLFKAVPERERGAEYDGHTPQEALDRMLRLARSGAAERDQARAEADRLRQELRECEAIRSDMADDIARIDPA